MESNNAKLYTHVMIDQDGEYIRFGESAPCPIGLSLFDFLEQMTSHPYFRQKAENYRETMSEIPVEKMIDVQNNYKAMVDNFFVSGTHSPLSDHLTDYKCIAGLGLCFSEDGHLWLDYLITDFEDCLYLEMREILMRRLKIKRCKNCGRYFIPKKGNVDYCHRRFTGDGKTCAQVGYAQTFAKSVKSDELLQAYTRAYKAHYARMSKPRKKAANITREDFEAWYAQAKQKLEQARSGELDAETFIQWLKQ